MQYYLRTAREAHVLIANKDEITAELKEQIAVKDAQIAKLTDTMNAQAVHIQSLINQKQIELQELSGHGENSGNIVLKTFHVINIIKNFYTIYNFH
jgi:hypothetical protein